MKKLVNFFFLLSCFQWIMEIKYFFISEGYNFPTFSISYDCMSLNGKWCNLVCEFWFTFARWKLFKVYHQGQKRPIIYYNILFFYILIFIKTNDSTSFKYFISTIFWTIIDAPPNSLINSTMSPKMKTTKG